MAMLLTAALTLSLSVVLTVTSTKPQLAELPTRHPDRPDIH
ncbi:hypothetical protein [Streptomyces hilarionis]|nr:hypothetical protein [Streptomyces hilarionis]